MRPCFRLFLLQFIGVYRVSQVSVLSGPRQSPVHRDFSFHEFDDELVVNALREGVEDGFGQGFGLAIVKSLYIVSCQGGYH
jgi:hypothetical protein